MIPFAYRSGEEIKSVDRIRYKGSPGRVEFIVIERTGDPTIDWYLEEFPGGGVMVTPETFGRLFLSAEDIREDDWLEFVSRAAKEG